MRSLMRARYRLPMSFALIALASAVLVLVPGPAAAAEAKPNILLIMVDDLGKEWISCYGGQEMKTPQIDKLAARGMRFNNAYSMPQCTPPARRC